jgi:GntR family transcriptional regulator of arabinose operon
MDRIQIDREGAVPLHVQLLNQLRQLILSGRWIPDTRIPSELELQGQLNISRGTVRQALRNAEAEGLIIRVPGKGTFVAPSPHGTSSSNLIGYVTDNCLDPMQSQVLTGAQGVITACGFRTIFGYSNGNLQEENQLLEQLVDEIGVAGVIIWPVPREEPSGRLLQLGQQGVTPLVAVDRTVEGLSCDFVSSENYAGAYAAVKHLVELGHRRIVFLSHPVMYLTTVAERWRGYQDAMRACGLAPRDPWLVGSPGRETSVRAVVEDGVDAYSRDVAEIAQYIKSTPRPTAIFAINDAMTIQALKAAKLLGLGVPEDLSLVGFDDDSVINTVLDLPLTAVAQDVLGLGERAAELLIERVQGYSGSARKELLPTELRVRASTASPPILQSAGEAVDSGMR